MRTFSKHAMQVVTVLWVFSMVYIFLGMESRLEPKLARLRNHAEATMYFGRIITSDREFEEAKDEQRLGCLIAAILVPIVPYVVAMVVLGVFFITSDRQIQDQQSVQFSIQPPPVQRPILPPHF